MQTRKGSLTESLTNTGVGFILSVVVWELVVKPVWHIDTTFIQNVQITTLFTVISILRGYAVRRFFNHVTNKKKKPHDAIDWDHRARALWKR